MSHYQVPRQVTTRLEFVPGFGLREAAGAGSGAAIGLVFFQIATWLSAPYGVPVLLLVIPAALGCVLVVGGENSLLSLVRRKFWFKKRPQRLIYSAGTGRAAEQPSGTQADTLSPSIVKQVLQKAVKPQPGDKSSAAPTGGSVQEWLPVVRIDGGVLRRRDGAVVAAILVEPVNLGLKSPSEQARIVQRVHEAMNALQQPAQILSLSRPLDLEGYVGKLASRLSEVDKARQRLLKPYYTYVMSLVAGGEAQERRYYILLPQAAGHGADALALQAAHDLASRLRHADINTSVLDDQALMDLLYVWCNPVQAAFESSPTGPAPVTSMSEG